MDHRELGLRCRGCGRETEVTDSRPVQVSVRRRRRCCKDCGEPRFTTFERRVGEAVQLTHLEAASVVGRIACLSQMIREMEGEIKELSELLAP